jgi:ferric-dicitrate binding protein FerR (iron transport regulator)
MHTKTTRRSPVAAALFALIASLTASPALAASGTALGVDQSAELQSNATTKVLDVGSDIFIGDKVITGPSGQVQIKFSDKTELVVGPNSSLLIEDYLLREDNSAGQFAIKALGGTFRFVTGQAEKDRYKIETPTGTIGVRGTAFDFNVDPIETRVLLFHGAVILCNSADQCVTLDDVCELGQYDLTQSVVLGSAEEITGDQREALKGEFKYAESQAPLLHEFWVENARECFNRGFVANVPESLGSDGSNNPGGDKGGDGGEGGDLPPPPDGCWYEPDGSLFCL